MEKSKRQMAAEQAWQRALREPREPSGEKKQAAAGLKAAASAPRPPQLGDAVETATSVEATGPKPSGTEGWIGEHLNGRLRAGNAPGMNRPFPSATTVGRSRRHAYCPLCGEARTHIPLGELRAVEEAVCRGRCLVAWQALTALWQRESASDRIATRRRSESESGKPHLPLLSALLLDRWRAGDWTIDPEDLLLQIELGPAATPSRVCERRD